MPELWIPYGPVETLVTVQAENLGTIVEPETPRPQIETEHLVDEAKRASSIFVCDSIPPTIELLKVLTPGISLSDGHRISASAPKRIESAVPELKGKVATLPPPVPSAEEKGTVYAPELTAEGTKIFLGTAKPDPLFGIVDPKLEACMNWVAHSITEAISVRKTMEPAPFHKTEPRDRLEELAEAIRDATYLTAVPSGGRIKSVLEDAPFDAVKNSFPSAPVQQARAIVVGAGGKGYDDTLSSALRGVWSAIPGVKPSGQILLMAECSEGLGSTALEILATGRLESEPGLKKGKYLEGTEEVFYLDKLKEEYDVLLLSGLPEIYAKSKLGLTTARGSGEAVGRLLNRLGRTGKMNVVPRASEVRIESA